MRIVYLLRESLSAVAVSNSVLSVPLFEPVPRDATQRAQCGKGIDTIHIDYYYIQIQIPIPFIKYILCFNRIISQSFQRKRDNEKKGSSTKIKKISSFLPYVLYFNRIISQSIPFQ